MYRQDEQGGGGQKWPHTHSQTLSLCTIGTLALCAPAVTFAYLSSTKPSVITSDIKWIFQTKDMNSFGTETNVSFLSVWTLSLPITDTERQNFFVALACQARSLWICQEATCQATLPSLNKCHLLEVLHQRWQGSSTPPLSFTTILVFFLQGYFVETVYSTQLKLFCLFVLPTETKFH